MKNFNRSDEEWSQSEYRILKMEFYSGLPISEISDRHLRSYSSIILQLHNLKCLPWFLIHKDNKYDYSKNQIVCKAFKLGISIDEISQLEHISYYRTFLILSFNGLLDSYVDEKFSSFYEFNNINIFDSLNFFQGVFRDIENLNKVNVNEIESYLPSNFKGLTIKDRMFWNEYINNEDKDWFLTDPFGQDLYGDEVNYQERVVALYYGKRDIDSMKDVCWVFYWNGFVYPYNPIRYYDVDFDLMMSKITPSNQLEDRLVGIFRDKLEPESVIEYIRYSYILGWRDSFSSNFKSFDSWLNEITRYALKVSIDLEEKASIPGEQYLSFLSFNSAVLELFKGTIVDDLTQKKISSSLERIQSKYNLRSEIYIQLPPPRLNPASF
uniref:hypothetical protein n=1 Tax=Marinobacterium profundum TaxID=1714300 RepID=UPI0008326870|nr:hypothetical protein [Marinobacterium profundum]